MRQRCAAVALLQGSELHGQRQHPPWLANARIPVLIGGHIGFVSAYFIGLFTIFHVAAAYKKLELKV